MPRFGGSVDLVDRNAAALAPALPDFIRQHVPAAEAVCQRPEIIAVDAVVFKDHSIQGRDAQQPAHPAALDAFQDGVHLRNGHEEGTVALVQPDGHEQAQGHDVKERVDGDVGVAAFVEMSGRHVLGDVVDVGGHSDVGARDALRKSGGAAGVKDVSEVLFGIDGDRCLHGAVPQQGTEPMDVGPILHPAGGDFVEKRAQRPFPGRQQVGHVRHDHVPRTGLGERFPDIAEIGVRAYDRLHTAVPDHVGDFMGGVDRRNRHDDRADPLDAQKRDHPLNRVGDIDHHAVAARDAHVGQRPGEAFAQIPQAAVGEGFSQEDDGRQLRVLNAHAVKTGEGQFLFNAGGGALRHKNSKSLFRHLARSRNTLRGRPGCPSAPDGSPP